MLLAIKINKFFLLIISPNKSKNNVTAQSTIQTFRDHVSPLNNTQRLELRPQLKSTEGVGLYVGDMGGMDCVVLMKV